MSISHEKGHVSTEKASVSTQKAHVFTEKASVSTEKASVSTEHHVRVSTEKLDFYGEATWLYGEEVTLVGHRNSPSFDHCDKANKRGTRERTKLFGVKPGRTDSWRKNVISNKVEDWNKNFHMGNECLNETQSEIM